MSRDTLRYYEKVGILPGIHRSKSGHRQFSDQDMGWIRLVQCLRATGMPIEDLHTYAELMQQGESTARQRLQLLETHRRRIKSEMSELATALELVEHKIEGYDQLLTRGLKGDPPKRRPAPRRVRISASD